MYEKQRTFRYSLLVSEKSQHQDQETLARYTLLLENKIQKKMAEKHGLLIEKEHLDVEAQLMRYTLEEYEDMDKTGGAPRAHKKATPEDGAKAIEAGTEEAAENGAPALENG